MSIDVEPVRGRTGDSKLEVWVPVGVRVVARSTSGDVTVKGTKAEVDAHSTSGDVVVQDRAGRLVVRHSSP